ncbi:CBASS oligonucleotide cyclase, partial [Janthinobacterium sp.]|uniref:CBASS oligonucleotide cyclase n=1 Tax=Janthinobacterium sp. TaxID=1871054 RepID=UPI00293D89AF
QQAFVKLKVNLEISNLQAEVISTRQKSVREVLDNGLTVSDTFLTGSYVRNTMIAPLKQADVDIIVILDNKYFHNYNSGQNGGQAGLLDLVKRTLLRTYTSTPDISRSGQAVTIRFSDFVVDVVPGFHRSGGGFLIPNSITSSWISTDPKKHVDLSTDANRLHNGDLVPLIKMIKCWNRERGGFFRSFHLEVLAWEVLKGVQITDYSSGVRYYFDKCRTLVGQKNLDPAGYGGDIGSYINTTEKIQEAVKKFETAFEKAIRAEEAALQGRNREAIEIWAQLFGGYFPAYG